MSRHGPAPKPVCGRGHLNIPENRYKNGSCRLCAVESRKAWYRANKEHHKALMDDWYSKNHARQLELQRNWYVRNRERHLQNTADWAASNPILKAHYARVRRAKIRGAAGTSSPEQLLQRMAFFHNLCSYCGGPFEEIDHAIPLSRGGSNWPANLRPSRVPCNRSKGTKTIWEFLEARAA